MKSYMLNLANYSVGVKTEEFFREQNGHKQSWGRNWVRVEAKNMFEARCMGVEMRKKRGEEVLEVRNNPIYADERQADY